MPGGSAYRRITDMSVNDSERLWMRKSSEVAAKVNVAWWVEKFNWLLLGFLILSAVALLVVRSTVRPQLPYQPVLLILGGGILIVSLGAWAWSRSRFIDRGAALVRLDDVFQMHNRLTSAAAGIGSWPEKIPDVQSRSLRWSIPVTWVPILSGAALLALAWWFPIAERHPGTTVTPVEPGAWEQMEDWLATLEDEQLIDEESIEEYEEKIEELRAQPEEEWFSHSSLEATDTLQDSLGREIRDLASEMSSLERSLDALQKYNSEMSEGAKQQLMKEFEEALEALQNGGMQANEALLSQLGEIDPSQLGQESLSGMTAEQLQQLQEQLQQGGSALGSMEGLPSMSEDPSLQQGQLGQGTMPGLGEGPGMGGVDRGRADAPLFFGDEDDLRTDNLQGVNNKDLSRATPGEVLGIGESERDIDETKVGPVSGGEVSSTGRGGEAVSRDFLMPDEQAVLKRYFK